VAKHRIEPSSSGRIVHRTLLKNEPPLRKIPAMPFEIAAAGPGIVP
jgi:hypothetical protein